MSGLSKVYIVEDDEDNADLLIDYYEGDFDFTVFNDSVQAWGDLRSGKVEKPDLFLLDISMPVMDGIELIGKLKSSGEFRGIPAIALTAHAMSTDRDRFIEAGFDEYFSKPITDFEALREKMAALIGG